VRRDPKFPLGLMDIITVTKTKNNYRVLYDVKGRFKLVKISKDEAKVSLHITLISSTNCAE